MICVLLAKKMAKIWLKLQENGEKKSKMAKEKYILARTLTEIKMYLYLSAELEKMNSPSKDEILINEKI